MTTREADARLRLARGVLALCTALAVVACQPAVDAGAPSVPAGGDTEASVTPVAGSPEPRPTGVPQDPGPPAIAPPGQPDAETAAPSTEPGASPTAEPVSTPQPATTPRPATPRPATPRPATPRPATPQPTTAPTPAPTPAIPAGAAQLTSPSNGATLPGATVTFTWSTVPGVYWYSLYFGAIPPDKPCPAGSFCSDDATADKTYGQSGSMLHPESSYQKSGLPTNGATIYVRLFTQTTSTGPLRWRDYTFTAAGS